MLNFPKVVIVQVEDHYDSGVEIVVLLSEGSMQSTHSWCIIIPLCPVISHFSEFNIKMSGGMFVHFKLNMLKLKITEDE